MNQIEKAVYTEACSRLSGLMHNGPFKYSSNMRDVKWFARRITEVFTPSGIFVDIGGGLNPVNAVLAEMGMNVHVVDFDIEKYAKSEKFEIIRKSGVNFIQSDGLDFRFEQFRDAEVDAIGSFHTFEHFHHSPRKLCESAMRALKPGGKIVIETPNAANLKKRIGLLFGTTNYLEFGSYYECEQYWMHVREYTVGDMEYLANRLHLQKWKIFGLNYFGSFYSASGSLLPFTPIDMALRTRPGLCSSIFLSGIK